MTIDDLKTFLYPLNQIDSAKFLGISEAYIKKIMAGDRPVPDNILDVRVGDILLGLISSSDVLGFFRDSKSARKSRQQMRNKTTYKQFMDLMGDRFNKCKCCLYPAHESIYGKYLCEQCIDKMKVKTVETSKEDLTD